jgi:hypothetical protein
MIRKPERQRGDPDDADDVHCEQAVNTLKRDRPGDNHQADGAARTNGLSSAGFDGWIGGTCHRRTRGGLLRPPLADCLMDAINQIANTPCPWPTESSR